MRFKVKADAVWLQAECLWINWDFRLDLEFCSAAVSPLSESGGRTNRPHWFLITAAAAWSHSWASLQTHSRSLLNSEQQLQDLRLTRDLTRNSGWEQAEHEISKSHRYRLINTAGWTDGFLNIYIKNQIFWICKYYKMFYNYYHMLTLHMYCILSLYLFKYKS